MVIDNMLMPLNVECWIDAYRKSDSLYVEKECRKLKSLLLSNISEISGVSGEGIIFSGGTPVPESAVDKLKLYVDGPADFVNNKYEIVFYASQSDFGKPLGDFSFIKCLVFKNGKSDYIYPVNINVARLIKDESGLANFYEKILLSADVLNKLQPHFTSSIYFSTEEVWLDILINPGEFGINHDWLSKNGYI